MEAPDEIAEGESRWWTLERRQGETLRVALERTLRDAISSGALRPGVRMPGSRTLARELGVSRGVVTDAYSQLQSQGFLLAAPRAALRVAEIAPPPPWAAKPQVQEPPVRYDLTPTTPDVSLFPVRRWQSVSTLVARRAERSVLDYREPAGERELRHVLADHLGRTRGAIAEPDQIVVVQGTAQSISLVLRVLALAGARSIAVEDPSHTTQVERIEASGLSLHAQRIDELGLCTEGLDGDAVLVTPAHQFPTGVVMSADRRHELLGWAKAHDAWIIEDDYDAEFRYDREPARALQGVAPDRVVQLGTVSKTLAPALRLGWMVAPPEFAEAATAQRRLLDDFSPALPQLTLAEFIRNGDYDRHVRRARSVYRRRRDTLLTQLRRQLPELEVAGVAAGVHLLVRLPAGVDDAAIVREARRALIHAEPLSRFSIHAPDRGLVIGYGRVHEDAIKPAINALAKIVSRHLD